MFQVWWRGWVGLYYSKTKPDLFFPSSSWFSSRVSNFKDFKESLCTFFVQHSSLNVCKTFIVLLISLSLSSRIGCHKESRVPFSGAIWHRENLQQAPTWWLLPAGLSRYGAGVTRNIVWRELTSSKNCGNATSFREGKNNLFFQENTEVITRPRTSER